jgi:2-oxo-4-hydroxy-4-carboxy-5-ureidoimidazoline decarboxylase
MTLEELNSLSPRDCVTLFRQCCGSVRWAQAMRDRRPFQSARHLYEVAEEIWNGLAPEDWNEAFAHHPKIGDITSLRKKYRDTGASREQSGVRGAPERTLKALAEGNNLYEAKFGYIFIVCASGKSADEMLAILNKRLGNIPSEEMKIAAREQAKITRLRLETLLLQS